MIERFIFVKHDYSTWGMDVNPVRRTAVYTRNGNECLPAEVPETIKDILNKMVAKGCSVNPRLPK